MWVEWRDRKKLSSIDELNNLEQVKKQRSTH